MVIKKILKSSISVILILLMIMSLFSITAFALETEETQEVKTNEKVAAPAGANFDDAENSANFDNAEIEATTQTEANAAFPLETPHIKDVITINGRDIVISWDAIKSAYEYRIFIKSGSTWKCIGKTIDLNFVWSGGVVNTTYIFTIRCFDASGNATSSFDSKGFSYFFQFSKPKITSIAYSGNVGVKVNWDKVPGAENYRLFAKSSPTGKWTKLADTTNNYYVYKSVPYNSKYYYTVRCLSKDGKTYTSSYDSNGFVYQYKLDMPRINKMEVLDDGHVKISWKAVPTAKYYKVYYKTDTSWKTIGQTSTNSYTWNGFELGKSYTYTCRCVDANGTAISTFYAPGYTYTVYLSKPVISSVEKYNSNKVKISWGKVDGATKYRVFYKNGTSWKTIADTTSTSYVWSKAVIAKEYTYTVRCVNSSGNYASSFDPVGKSFKLMLDTPKITSVAPAESVKVKITWGKVTGAEKYRVFYKNGTSWKTIANVDTNSYTWSKAAIGKEYIYTVRCISSDLKTFTSDYDKTGKPYKLWLTSPKISSFSATSNSSFKISWGKVTGAAKYRVFVWSNSAGHYKKLGDTANTSFTATNATLNSSYKLTVRCVAADGVTWQSDYNKDGFIYKFQLNTPKVSSAVSQGGSSVKISWANVPGGTKYRVFIKNDTSWKVIGTVNTNTFTWKSAVVNNTYTFTVRCINDKGEFVSSFDVNGYKYIHQLATPYISSVTSSGKNTLTAVWGKIEGATKYRVYYKKYGGSWTRIGEVTTNSFKWTAAPYNVTIYLTVRCVNNNGDFTSSFDGKGFPYIISSATAISKIAQNAISEYNFWKSGGSSKYSCQGEKYWKDCGCSPNDWCGYFATYCVRHGVSSANWDAIRKASKTDGNLGWVPTWKTLGQGMKSKAMPGTTRWHTVGSGYVPQPGDAAIWGDLDHVSIVTKVNMTKQTFDDVGGNEGWYDDCDTFYDSIVCTESGFSYTKAGYDDLYGFVELADLT